MAYKIGDKVRIRKDFGKVSGTFVNEMKKWGGKVMTIIGIAGDDYIMKEDQGQGPIRCNGRRYWYWNDTMIAGIAEQKSVVYSTLL